MKINSFEEIVAWQKARVLTKEVYIIFKSHTDYGFKDQIQRASVSVMNNIAEGFERRSNNELRQFLYISKGSAGEVRSMLLIAHDLGYINDEKHDELLKLCMDISRLLSGFIKTL